MFVIYFERVIHANIACGYNVKFVAHFEAVQPVSESWNFIFFPNERLKFKWVPNSFFNISNKFNSSILDIHTYNVHDERGHCPRPDIKTKYEKYSSAISSQQISGKNSENKYIAMKIKQIRCLESSLSCRSRHLCIKLTHTT